MTWAGPWGPEWDLQSHKLSLCQAFVTFIILDMLGMPQSPSFQLGKNQPLLKHPNCCLHKKPGTL